MAPKSNFHCDIRASFATAFRNWRLKSNIPLKTIAVDLGVSIATVNSWESGKRFPTGRHFEMLTDYTAVPAFLRDGGQVCPGGMFDGAAAEEAIRRQRALPAVTL